MWDQTQTIFLDSLRRVVLAAARLLPGVFAMLLLLLLAGVLALGVRMALRRLCAHLELDRRAREWGLIGPAGSSPAPSRVVELLGSWTVLALGFVMGLTAFDAGATSTLASRLMDYMPHVVVAVAIMALGIAAARAVERAVLIGAVNMGLTSARLLGLGTRWLVVVLSAAMALQHLGIGGHVVPVSLGVLFGGIVLALALSFGLGAREVVARSLERRFGQHEEAEEDRSGDDVQHM